MNKGNFIDALAKIDEKLICEYMPQLGNISYAQSKKTKARRLIPAIAACMSVGILFTTVLWYYFRHKGFNNSVMVPGDINTTTDSAQPSDVMLEFPVAYPNFSDSYSLLQIEDLIVHGVYYKHIYGYGYSINEVSSFVIIEARVTNDYYGHLMSGDKLHVAFPVNFFLGEFHRVDADKISEILSGCETIIFYTGSLNRDWDSENYAYKDADCDEKSKIYFENFCFCDYFSDGIIPISNSCVDFSEFDALFEMNNMCTRMHHFYNNIKRSGYSISQGDSVDKVTETINKLIDIKVYGG